MQAETEALRLRDEVAKVGQVWNGLTAHERERAIASWRESQTGLQPGPKITLSKAITELIQVKKSAGRSGRYTDNLKIILDQFAKGRESTALASVSLADVETFLNSKAIASRSTLRARLSTLFKFAIRRGYRIDNPCARLEPVTVPHTPPAIFTVEQVGECLKALSDNHKPHRRSRVVNYRHALPWFVLTTFCGLRPEEAEQTTSADIHLKEGWIKIEAQTTKVRQRRVVEPLAPAMAILKRVLKEGRLPLDSQSRRRVIRRLRQRLGFAKWPKDITRHSAASYWLAECRSAALVSESLGNSESVLKRNYQALVTREEAKRFWLVASNFRPPRQPKPLLKPF
jgi:integrase